MQNARLSLYVWLPLFFNYFIVIFFRYQKLRVKKIRRSSIYVSCRKLQKKVTCNSYRASRLVIVLTYSIGKLGNNEH